MNVPPPTDPKAAVKIWDIPVRLFHWLLVVCVAAAAFTGFLAPVNWLNLHLLAGTTIAVLIALRLVWGFTGTAYARFANFDIRPKIILAHLREFGGGGVHRTAGHNPLGALMVIALLGTLGIILLTGTLLLGGVFKQGPLKAYLTFSQGWSVREIHELAAWAILALVGAHIGGVIFESRRTEENLARAMVTGKKRGGFADPLIKANSKPVLAAIAGLLLVGSGVAVATALTAKPPLGVPVMTANAAWQKECAACHIAFHPSLLPAKSWDQVMSNLADHFGEDASLDAETTKTIREFLVANAGEQWDTLPANRLRKVNPEKPMEITATPFWTRMHGEIDAAIFTAKPIGAKQNCAACHGDAATGMFAPQNISIPKETLK